MSEDFTFTYRKTVITLADPRLLRSASRDEGGDAPSFRMHAGNWFATALQWRDGSQYTVRYSLADQVVLVIQA